MEAVAEHTDEIGISGSSEAFRPVVVVTVALLTVSRGQLTALVSAGSHGRAELPWYTPRPGQSLDAAAREAAVRVAGTDELYVEQLYTATVPEAGSPEALVEIGYLGLVAGDCGHAGGSALPAGSAWWPVTRLPDLAPNHASTIHSAQRRLRNLMMDSPVAAHLLPAEFTLSDLQQLYEIVQDRVLDKRNFRKWVLASGFIAPTPRERRDGAHRPARLYRFVS